MNAKLSPIVFKWLQYAGVTVSKKYIDDQLQSHPDYPALVSITDTLDELGIENMSLVVDKEKLNELPVPFLAHSPLNGGGFVVINNIEQQIRQDKEFEKNWDGIVVFAEKPTGWHHAGNENFLAKEKTIRQQTTIGIAAIVLLAGFTLFNHFAISLAGLLFASIAGLGIAILIVQQELGISNGITEQLCSAGKETDCNAVISSKGVKLAGWFSWSDAGIIYFTSCLMVLVASPARAVLPLISAAAIPFVFFSAYYQWRVVRKWCTLCLMTVAVLILQFVLSLPSLLRFDSSTISLNVIAITGFIFFAIAIIWLLAIKPALQKNKQLEEKNFSLQRFKNSPDIFYAFLQQQRKVDTTPFENDLQLGNPDSPVQIMVACNPYCGPCARAHEVLHGLVEKIDIGLTIRFSLKAGNKNDKRTLAVEYLLKVINKETSRNKRKTLHDWYSVMDIEKFRKQYSLSNNEDVDTLLKQHEEWAIRAKIQFTPTIFINGYELPKHYQADEMKNMVTRCGQIMKADIETATEVMG